MANDLATGALDYEAGLDPLTQQILALQRLQQALGQLSASTGAAADIQEQPGILDRLRGGAGSVATGAGDVLSNLVAAPPSPVPGISLEEMNARYPARNTPKLGTGELIGGTLGSIINALNREHGARITRSTEQIGALQRKTIEDVASGKFGDLSSPEALQKLSVILSGKPSAEPARDIALLERARVQSAARQQNVQAALGSKDFATMTRDLLPKYKAEFFAKYRQLQGLSDQSAPEAGQLITELQDIGERSQAEKVQADRGKLSAKAVTQERGRIQRLTTQLSLHGAQAGLTPEELNALAQAQAGVPQEDLAKTPEDLTKHLSLVESAQKKLDAGTAMVRETINKRLDNLDSQIAERANRTQINLAALRQRGLIFQSQQQVKEFELFFRAKLQENLQRSAAGFRQKLQAEKGEAFTKALEKLKTGEKGDGVSGLFGAIGALFGFGGGGTQGQPATEATPKEVEQSITDHTYDQAVQEYQQFKQTNPTVDINESVNVIKLQGKGAVQPELSTPASTVKPKAQPPARKPGVQDDVEQRIREKYGL